MAVSSSRLIQRAALFCMALGILMTVALFAAWPVLTRFVPGTPGMVLDTAIGIFLVGLGLWFAQRKILFPLRFIAAILLLAGAFNLFVRNPRIALHSYAFPGIGNSPTWPTWPQMAQGTAAAFALVATALLLLARAKPSMLAFRLTALLGTMVATLGIITLLAYAAGLYAAPWWAETFLFDMAIPTALACCVMGAALIAFFLKEAEGAPHQLSITAGILSIFCVLLMVAGADASLWTSASSILTNRPGARKISDELFATYALLENIRRAETGQHGYLLTGDEQYLRIFSVGEQGIDEISRHQGVHDAKLLRLIDLKIDELRRTIALEQQGKHAEAIGIVKSQAGLRTTEQIEQRAASVIAGLRREWDLRKNRNTLSVDSIRTTILWSYAMVILLACCALWLAAMEIRRRSRIEAHLRTSEASLASTVSKLSEQTARAEEASRAKSSFLASMSHEIRTPMTAILGMADMLAESQLSQTQRHYVEVFRRAGGNLLTIVNGILDLSKIESGTLELEATGFDVRDTVEQVIETLTPKAEAKGICLAASIAPGAITTVVGDPARLQQVLFNLIGNAIKFTARGEVVLSVSSQASATHASLDFAVSDTGIGIADDQLPHIFDDFKQAESSTTRRFGGTGLGLGISRRLVRLMGGDLRVQSGLGKGSTFSFNVVLPIGVRSKTPTPPELQNMAGKRILIVDDTAINRVVLSDIVSPWGLEVTSCSSGAEAIELAAKATAGRQFDLALIDKLMPGMGGFETAGRIMVLQPKAAIFIVSSDNLDGDIARCREMGLAGHLMKPVRHAELLHEITRALSGISQPPEPSVAGFSKTEKSADHTKRRRILIAEDSEDNRFLLRAYCQETDFELTFAEDGKQAVDAYQAGPFETIVMDVQMPVMDGLTAALQIRLIESDRGLERVPILALTANALHEDVKKSLDAGCDAHLAKPISKEDFLSALDRWQAHTA